MMDQYIVGVNGENVLNATSLVNSEDIEGDVYHTSNNRNISKFFHEKYAALKENTAKFASGCFVIATEDDIDALEKQYPADPEVEALANEYRITLDNFPTLSFFYTASF